MESISQMTNNKEITISSLLNEISNLTEENNFIIKDIHEYKKELNTIAGNQINEFINLSQSEIDEKLNNILDDVLNEEVDNNLIIEKKEEKIKEPVNIKEPGNIKEPVNIKEIINDIEENDNDSESTIDKNDLEYNSDNSEIINNNKQVESINVLKEQTTKTLEDTNNFVNIPLFSELIKNMDKNKSAEKMDVSKMKEELNKMTSLFSNLGINGFGDIFNQITNMDNFNKNETEDLESFILENDNNNLDNKLSDHKSSDTESYDITDDESSDIEGSDIEGSDIESSNVESSNKEENVEETNTENLGNNIFSNFSNLFNIEFLTNKLGLTQNFNNKQTEEDLDDFVDDNKHEQECEKVECCTNDFEKLNECLDKNTKMFDELTNMMKGLGLNLHNSENINKKEKND